MFAAAALAGCKGKNGAGDVQQDNRVLTKTETAESATVQLTEEFTSEIEPFRENDITPAASGVHIDRILVEVGDPVHEGDARPDAVHPAARAAEDRRGRLQPPVARL